MRRNFSEQKGSVGKDIKLFGPEGYTKPLSLMSSVKKFEIDPEDIVSKDIKFIAQRNLLKRKSNFLAIKIQDGVVRLPGFRGDLKIKMSIW